jgi:hypothetical protein
MDKQLVDNLLKVILDDKEEKHNTYDKLDKLLLTMGDEELDYFLEQCDENVFSNYDLFEKLSLTIPQKMMGYVERFVEKKLYIVGMMEKSLNNEYLSGRISKELYEETLEEYETVREQGKRFLKMYLDEISKEPKK